VRLLWIEAKDFRNYGDVSLQVPPGLTAVVGSNGQGKTNLLEAMYYLCSLVSPRVSADLPLVRRGAGSAFLRGEVEGGDGRLLIEVEVRGSGQNKVQANRTAVRRKRDLRRRARSVFGGPEDLAIVLGDPSERRRFMDEAVAVLWPTKDGVVGAYERVLRQRNRLLKEWPGPGEPVGLEAWDAELIAHGSVLTTLRGKAVELMQKDAAEEFRRVAGDDMGSLAVEYRPSVEAPPTLDGRGPEEAFGARLAARRGDELIRRTTLVGPHRDDLGLTVQDLAARGFASHGEAWGAAVALRLALARAVRDETSEDPILLLDDPFSALDPERRRRLAEGLSGRGQVVMAVPDRAQVPPEASVWTVDGGRVEPA
jgi:DNA replication and repair protein RecF